MTPIEHSWLSVRDFGGNEKDYLALHEYLDQTKFHVPDPRHRMFLHSTLGIKICEDVFSPYLTNSTGLKVPVRELIRRHIFQDCSAVPTPLQWLTEPQKFNRPSRKDLEWLKQYNHVKEAQTTAEQ